jgi:SAM-dependent methyltransferase
MEHYDDATYGERIAGVYDELYQAYDESAVTFLADLAHGGPALELGIGTGRMALPLQARGVKVHGLDASPAMTAKLAAKPGGAGIPMTMGDFAEVAVAGQFPLVYVVFNTFFALLTQEKQVQCFANVARRLTPDGVFVIEAFVPDMTRFRARQNMQVIGMNEDEVRFDASQLDPVGQTVLSRHVFLSAQGVRLYPVRLRFAWPAELDLMARLAGLRLRERWGNWQRAPFSADAGKHISVYGR